MTSFEVRILFYGFDNLEVPDNKRIAKTVTFIMDSKRFDWCIICLNLKVGDA